MKNTFLTKKGLWLTSDALKCYSYKFTDTDEEDLITKYNTANILGSNKLAQKNLSIIQKNASNNFLSTISVRNTVGTMRNYTLEIRPETGADKDLFTTAQVDIKLSQPILNAWQRDGSRAAKVVYSSSNPTLLQLQASDSKIYSINLDKNEFEKISLECTFKSSFVTVNKTYSFDLIQKDEITGEIVGGESFVITSPGIIPHRPIIIQPVLNENKYILNAESTDSG